jgi:hypothetical protein
MVRPGRGRVKTSAAAAGIPFRITAFGSTARSNVERGPDAMLEQNGPRCLHARGDLPIARSGRYASCASGGAGRTISYPWSTSQW